VLRCLRIAWSVGWGIVCVLLVVLWVRSYWWHDSVRMLAAGKSVHLASDRGLLSAVVNQRPPMRWELVSQPTSKTSGPIPEWVIGSIPRKLLGIRWAAADSGTTFTILPQWIPIAISAALAICTWLPWRFSLRSLLIAIMLMSLGLGMVVWLSS
jgi:hypothetical protein